MNARSGLDPKDLEENVSGWSGCNNVPGRRSCKRRIRIRDQPGRYCNKLRPASLWFDSCGQQGNTPRQSVFAATLVAARCGNLMMHGTTHAHPAHSLVAARSHVPAGGSPHLALHTGEGRLSREERNHNNGDELEETFHNTAVSIAGFAEKCVPDHI